MERIFVGYALNGQLRGQIVEDRFSPIAETMDHWARCKIANTLGVAIRAVSVRFIIPLKDQVGVV